MGARGRRGLGAAAVAAALVLVGSASGAGAVPAGPVAATPVAGGPTWTEVQARLVRAGVNPQLPNVRAGASPAVSSASATRSVAVTPHTGLVGGQTVTVAGHGFAGVPTVVVAQCRAGAAGPDDCDLGTLGFLSPDASGSFSAPFTVRRTITPGGAPVACVAAPNACEIIATDASVATVDAHAPISFDPNAPGPDPHVTVTPSTRVRTGDTLTVTGRRFAPNDEILVDLCGPSTVCGLNGIESPVTTDGSGRFTTTLTAQLRTLDAALLPSDCLAVACAVVARSFSQVDYVASAPVTFDPTQPRPPVPSIKLRPATGLHHLQSVDVVGTGFDPGAQIAISQCGPGIFSCSFSGTTDPGSTVDASGNFTATTTVSRLVNATTLPFPGGLTAAAVAQPEPTSDCVTVACTVDVEQYAIDDPFAPDASAPLVFDASVPPPAMPVVRVSPTTRLPYRYPLRLTGTGLVPGETVSAEFCADSIDAGMCSGGPAGVVAADGTLTATVSVQRRISLDGSTIDCADPGTTCSLEVLGAQTFEDWTVPLSFAPDAPVPPPPTLRVTPARHLVQDQVVALSGTNFLPGPVALTECVAAPGDPFFGRCGGVGAATADAQGRLTGSFAVERLLGDGFGPPVDCATAVGACVLVAGGEESFDPPTEAALAFEPTGPVPAPPTVTLTPRVNLGDGEKVAVHGSGFTPMQPVLVLECRSGATSLGDCDLSSFAPVIADAGGAVTTDFTVSAHPRLFTGAVDCTAARRACTLLVVGLANAAESARVPISFLVPDLAVLPLTVTEGTGGVTPAPVVVALSDPAPVPVTVDWDAERDTATRADFGPTRGTVTIPAGATHVVVPLQVAADALDEGTEQFSVRIVRAPGARIVGERAVVRIHDDDARPGVSVADWTASEGDGVAYTLVGLSAPSGRTVTVDWHTHHDSAQAGTDFVWTKGTVTFAPGQQWAVVAVPLVDDHTAEPTEQFRVDLDTATHATVDRASGSVVINDDDGP